MALALEVADPAQVEATHVANAWRIFDKLVADYPENVEYRLGEADLPRLRPISGKRQAADESEASYRKALALLEPQGGQAQTARLLLERALVLNNLGELQTSIGRPAAEKTLRDAMATFEGLVDRGPASRENRHYLAIAQNNLGDFFLKRHRLADAAPYFARSAAIFEKLVAEVPSTRSICTVTLELCLMGRQACFSKPASWPRPERPWKAQWSGARPCS